MQNNPIFDPRESAIVCIYRGSDCLYRDHRGRRVVGDVEGFGRYWVLAGNCDVVVDDLAAGSREGSFRESFIATSRTDGDVEIFVSTGPEQAIVNSGRVSGSVDGPGWILEADARVRLGHEHRRIEVGGHPVPFLWGAESDRPMKIARSPARLMPVDSFSIGDGEALAARSWRVQNISKVSELSSCFGDGPMRTAAVASHLNIASWQFDCSACHGLVLCKTYDAFHGRQRARVHFDGRLYGWWYAPEQDRACRWRVSTFGIAGPIEAGVKEIAIDPPAGAPLWSVSEIEVWAILPAN